MNFVLYKYEHDIAIEAKAIVERYYSYESQRERRKKEIEIFYLLNYLKESNMNFKEVIPQEPGDAIVVDNFGDEHLVEIFRVFGNEENRELNKRIDKIFDNKEIEIETEKFDYSKLQAIFTEKLFEKNEKDYMKDNKYKSKNILVVTCEHDRCSICSSWIVHTVGEVERKIESPNYNNIFVIDYMASGKDGGPIVYNFYEQVKELRECKLL